MSASNVLAASVQALRVKVSALATTFGFAASDVMIPVDQDSKLRPLKLLRERDVVDAWRVIGNWDRPTALAFNAISLAQLEQFRSFFSALHSIVVATSSASLLVPADNVTETSASAVATASMTPAATRLLPSPVIPEQTLDDLLFSTEVLLRHVVTTVCYGYPDGNEEFWKAFQDAVEETRAQLVVSCFSEVLLGRWVLHICSTPSSSHSSMEQWLRSLYSTPESCARLQRACVALVVRARDAPSWNASYHHRIEPIKNDEFRRLLAIICRAPDGGSSLVASGFFDPVYSVDVWKTMMECAKEPRQQQQVQQSPAAANQSDNGGLLKTMRAYLCFVCPLETPGSPPSSSASASALAIPAAAAVVRREGEHIRAQSKLLTGIANDIFRTGVFGSEKSKASCPAARVLVENHLRELFQMYTAAPRLHIDLFRTLVLEGMNEGSRSGSLCNFFHPVFQRAVGDMEWNHFLLQWVRSDFPRGIQQRASVCTSFLLPQLRIITIPKDMDVAQAQAYSNAEMRTRLNEIHKAQCSMIELLVIYSFSEPDAAIRSSMLRRLAEYRGHLLLEGVLQWVVALKQPSWALDVMCHKPISADRQLLLHLLSTADYDTVVKEWPIYFKAYDCLIKLFDPVNPLDNMCLVTFLQLQLPDQHEKLLQIMQYYPSCQTDEIATELVRLALACGDVSNAAGPSRQLFATITAFPLCQLWKPLLEQVKMMNSDDPEFASLLERRAAAMIGPEDVDEAYVGEVRTKRQIQGRREGSDVTPADVLVTHMAQVSGGTWSNALCNPNHAAMNNIRKSFAQWMRVRPAEKEEEEAVVALRSNQLLAAPAAPKPSTKEQRRIIVLRILTEVRTRQFDYLQSDRVQGPASDLGKDSIAARAIISGCVRLFGSPSVHGVENLLRDMSSVSATQFPQQANAASELWWHIAHRQIHSHALQTIQELDHQRPVVVGLEHAFKTATSPQDLVVSMAAFAHNVESLQVDVRQMLCNHLCRALLDHITFRFDRDTQFIVERASVLIRRCKGHELHCTKLEQVVGALYEPERESQLPLPHESASASSTSASTSLPACASTSAAAAAGAGTNQSRES